MITKRFPPQLSQVLFAGLLALTGAASASSFGVAPLRIELGGAVRSSVVTVTNDSTEPLFLTVYAVDWDMDEAGVEKYTPTDDLVFYPQALNVPPGEKRVVRVSSPNLAPSATEKTYRLFLKETQNGSVRAPGAQVAMLVNFGVAVYTAVPAGKPVLSAEILSVAKGALNLQVKNSGNVQARLEALNFPGQPGLAFGSAYVLAGHRRSLTVPVTAADCARGRNQTLYLTAGDTTLSVPVDLARACP